MTDDAERSGLDEHGLPLPEPYTGPTDNALDYFTDAYAGAITLGDAIEMRGQNAFAHEVTPEDFVEGPSPRETVVGIAELWAESTWHEGETERDVELERSVAAIQEGDIIEVHHCPWSVNERGYVFTLPGGKTLPYEPYHDYDDGFLTRALDECAYGERLICRVRSVICNGGDNDVPCDPGFCWRVYSCKVTVMRRRIGVAS